METPHKGFVLPLLIIVVVLLIGGGRYLYTQKQRVSFLDEEIRVDVLSIYSRADLHYVNNELLHNKNGYTDVCNDVNVAPLIKELKNISNSVVCKDSAAAYAVSAQMKSDFSQYICIYGPMYSADDIEGVVRNSPISTTSCR